MTRLAMALRTVGSACAVSRVSSSPPLRSCGSASWHRNDRSCRLEPDRHDKASNETYQLFNMNGERSFILNEIVDDDLFFQVIARTGATVDGGVIHRQETP